MVISVLPYALFAGTLPSVIWLFYWLREDVDHPEPTKLIVSCFFAGACAVIIAIFGEKFFADLSSDQSVRYMLWAGVEEIVKFFVMLVVAYRSVYNDEPIDAMIYMITVALGFAAIENTLFILDPFQSNLFAQGLALQSMRFVGATLVHVVCSALIGFSLGYFFYKNAAVQIFSVILGIIAAITLHSLFNLSIINATTAGTIKIFMWIWAAVVVLMILFEEIKAVRPNKLQKNNII